jgi:hypothetical protein
MVHTPPSSLTTSADCCRKRPDWPDIGLLQFHLH